MGGSLRRKAPPTTAQQCAAVLENCRIVPRTTAVAAVMALCGVYALFFAVQAGSGLPLRRWGWTHRTPPLLR